MSSVFLPAGSAACIPLTRSQGPFAANGKSMVGATLAVALPPPKHCMARATLTVALPPPEHCTARATLAVTLTSSKHCTARATLAVTLTLPEHYMASKRCMPQLEQQSTA